MPPGSQVCRHHGRIFDRNHEADIDITDNSDLVYRLYARKSGSYFVNKVTRFQMEDLRPDLIERARAMTASRTANHPWKSLSVEELLCSASLFLKDIEKQLEGLTLEEIHLFGKGSTILSVLPQHKTDTIFRVENLEHYDDHDVIITKTYDRLIAFAQKYLGAPLCAGGRAERQRQRTPTVPTDMVSCTCPLLSCMPKIRPSPKCSGRSDWQTNWGPGCGILINTKSSTPAGPRNLLRAMCSARSFRLPRLRWKRSGRRTPPKLQLWHFAKSRGQRQKSCNIVGIKAPRILRKTTYARGLKADNFK